MPVAAIFLVTSIQVCKFAVYPRHPLRTHTRTPSFPYPHAQVAAISLVTSVLVYKFAVDPRHPGHHPSLHGGSSAGALAGGSSSSAGGYMAVGGRESPQAGVQSVGEKSGKLAGRWVWPMARCSGGASLGLFHAMPAAQGGACVQGLQRGRAHKFAGFQDPAIPHPIPPDSFRFLPVLHPPAGPPAACCGIPRC